MRLRRNRRCQEEHRIDDSLWQWIMDNHPILGRLTPAETEVLKTHTVRFICKKTWEHPGAASLAEEMKYSIAVQACLPVLNLGLEWYENWNTIVVVPKSFTQEHAARDAAGVVHEWSEHDSGESWSNGPVVLSMEDVEDSGWCDGYNVVIHEAVHRLDLTDGEMNGRPALPPDISVKTWFDIMSAAFADFSKRAAQRKRLKIDEYASEDDAEFFAVLSEYFFETPRVLRKEYPEVYGLFKDFFRQNPMANH